MKHLLILLILVYAGSVFGQKKYDKILAKEEVNYEAGNYSKAFGDLAKFQKKAFKKLGQQNVYTPTYYMRLAKNNLASGYISDFETNLGLAVSNSKTISQENSKSHGVILIEAGELHNLNGSFLVARDYLEQARKILEAGGFMKDGAKGQYNLALAEAMTGQGYFTEAIEILKEQEKYFMGKAVKQDTFVDAKGKLTSRKLTDEERFARYNDYARYMTLLANALRLQGDYNESDKQFANAGRWISKNMGESTTAYVRNQFLYASLLIENGLEESLPKDMEYSRTLNNLKIKHSASHYLGQSIYEEYLKQLQKQNSSARYLNTKLEYEKMINKNFKNASIYNVRLKAVEFDAKLDKEQTRTLENQANNLITNTPSLPRNNMVTANVSDFLYGLALYKKNYTSAEKYLTDIIDIKSNLLGSDAPETHLARLQLANFYLDNTNKINEAAKIYNDSYVDVVSKEIGSWHKDHLDILNHMAVLYQLTDKYSEASKSLDKAVYVSQAKFTNESYQYAAELTNIARLQIKLGEYEKAEENLNTSLKVLDNFRRDEDKKIYRVQAIETQATLFGIKGQFDEAEDALDRSNKIIRRAKTALGIDELSTARELSSLFIQLGRYSETEVILNNLIAESEKLYGTNSIRLIDPLVDKGQLALAKGDYTEAEKIAQRVNKIATNVYGEKSTKTAP